MASSVKSESIAKQPEKFDIDLKSLLGPSSETGVSRDTPYVKPYVEFLRQVYDKMDNEYYLPVPEKKYNDFVDYFIDNILSCLRNKSNTLDNVRYLGAGLLVKRLKDPSDIFTNFYPPFEAEEYKSEALGYELGIGIDGRMTDKGYLIEDVEIRSDPYKKGIRLNDIILEVDGKPVFNIGENELESLFLSPLGVSMELKILFASTGKTSTVQIDVVEFFKETLSTVSTGIPGLFYIKINQFNRKTGDDFKKVMTYFIIKGMRRLIIDLRGNAGGPPLAARDIAEFFLPKRAPLFYFQRKNRPKVYLKTESSPFTFKGEIAILINEESGSASELFSGTLKAYDRAILIGERSAGKTFLKSMFKFEDNSMLLLTTSLAYLYNGERFNPEGLKPDFEAPEKQVNLFGFVSKCMDSYYEKK